MYNCLKHTKNWLVFLTLLITKASFSQNPTTKDSLVNFSPLNKEKTILKRGNLSLEMIASVLPQAKITRDAGKYKLHSRLQSSYDIGINYLYNLNKSLILKTGFHFVVGKWNFFANIPSEDINNWDGRNIIEGKELWGTIRIPLQIEKKLPSKKENPAYVNAGIAIRYSGLMTDIGFGSTLLGSNNQNTNIFNADFVITNSYKPWITFLAGISRRFILRNYNILSVGLNADISTTNFLKGTYAITIPNQPVTSGSYSINGSALSLSAGYIFTGANKKLIPKHNKKTKETSINRKEVLTDYVFKSNHLQFNFAALSMLKARLKNQTGSHPVNSSAVLGLLLSFKYQINFNNRYSLITGPEVIIAGRNFLTYFRKDDFSPPLITDYDIKGINSYIPDMILSLPVLLEKRWLYASTKYLFADAGFRLNFSTGADLDVFSINLLNTSNSFYNAGGVEVYTNNDAKPWISIPLNAGHAWLLKNNNVLQLSICSNISLTKYVNGTYQVDVPGEPLTTGRYSSTGSFIGLSMNYIFTNANYRIRKAYEKKEGK
jgi:hypothetical protein